MPSWTLTPTVSARLLLLDRAVNLIDEGFDAALRIGELADSSMVATRIGEVRRVVVAAPGYLKQNPRIEEPGDLAKAPDHFAGAHPQFLEFSVDAGRRRPANRSVYASARDQ
jgi:DNA-binding transcriptional LysR family regulator